MTTLSYSEVDTARLAAELAEELSPGTLILLRGPLGSGKTVFARSLIRALCGDPSLEVPSPTFTLVQTYDSPKGLLWHFDLYRLKHADEVYELGWEEALGGGIILLEWPERLEGMRLPPHLDIVLAAVDNEPGQRKITVTRHEAR